MTNMEEAINRLKNLVYETKNRIETQRANYDKFKNSMNECVAIINELTYYQLKLNTILEVVDKKESSTTKKEEPSDCVTKENE